MIDWSFLLGSLILGGIGWITYNLYIWPYYITPLRRIPGPSSESLLAGNLKSLFVEENGSIHLDWILKYGKFVKVYGLFNNPNVVVTDPKILQNILVTQAYEFPKSPIFTAGLEEIIGNGLFMAEGESHKRQKKIMNLTFSHNSIKNMFPTFVLVALKVKGMIEDEINKGESKVIITPYISHATLDIIGLAGFKYELNSLTSPSKLAISYEHIMDNKQITYLLRILASYIPSIRKLPIDANKKHIEAIKVIDRVSKRLMEEKYHEEKSDKLDGNDLYTKLFIVNKTFSPEEKMTDEELRYQNMNFLLGGHATTNFAINWGVYLLAQHPHEQDLLREELVKAFPDKSKFDPNFNVINSLEYLNCIVKETLRLHPPATISKRYNTKDRFFDEYFIPKGTDIMIPIAALHRLPSVWGPTANDFYPKRWLDPIMIKYVTNFNYLPFLSGPRSCIGSKLALNEFKVLLCMLVRNFVFQPVEGFYARNVLGKPEPHIELHVSKVEV